MNTPKILVVYYSRSGHTKRIAEEIASALHADVEEIVDRQDRTGLWGYLWSGLDSLFEKPAEILDPVRDPADYDLVIVGTPVWTSSISTPVRAYLTRFQKRFHHDVAFFLTHGGSGAQRVFFQMEELCGKAPLGVMAFREAEIAQGKYRERLHDFTDLMPLRLAAHHAA